MLSEPAAFYIRIRTVDGETFASRTISVDLFVREAGFTRTKAISTMNSLRAMIESPGRTDDITLSDDSGGRRNFVTRNIIWTEVREISK